MMKWENADDRLQNGDENKWNRLILIRSLTIGHHDTIKVTNDSIIISKFSKEIDRQEILSYSLLRSNAPHDSQDIPHLLWRFDKAVSLSATAISMLPIDSETFVLGYCMLLS
jgi:hypothetical protein